MKSSILFTLVASILLIFPTAVYCQYGPPTQLGHGMDANYENYRVDKLIEGGEPSSSGDLTLAIPLISIPGRHGHSYDLRLSYNSNVTQKQTASWVGLGWNMETGFVERTVFGRSDDQKENLWPGQNLQLRDPELLTEPEMVGRLHPRHSTSANGQPKLKDQSDNYALSIDGEGMEILPFPDEIGKSDTVSKTSFMPRQWKPYKTEASWQIDTSQIANFVLTKEDGSIYKFTDTDYVHVEDLNFVSPYLPRQFRYPYRWNLTDILYPDGSTTRIHYKKCNQGNDLKRKYDNVIIDKNMTTYGDNFFGIQNYLLENGQVYYRYSVPDSIITNTHYAVIYSSTSTSDSTVCDCRFDSLIVYDKLSNRELKRLVFQYATNNNTIRDYNYNSVAPNWSSNVRLNDQQLTLTGITIKSGGLSLPSYKFSYTTNPRLCQDTSNLHFSSLDPGYPSYYLDTVFCRAWKLREIVLPSGGRMSYVYQRLDSVMYDPESRKAASSSPWSYRSEPRARLVGKTVSDSLGNNFAWSYQYGDAIYDAPSRPSGLFYVPRRYQNVDYTIKEKFFTFYRGCLLNHRWITTINPDASWSKKYYTSSYAGTGFRTIESYPDSILGTTPTWDITRTSIWSRYGKRGIVWKEETAADSTLYFYSFPLQGRFVDRYNYNFCPPEDQTFENVELTSYWARLDSVCNYRDGNIVSTSYKYNPTRRESISGNGMVNKTIEYGSGYNRITQKKYACEKYTGMDDLHMWSQEYSTLVKKDDKDESKDWTTYGNYYGSWLPSKQWQWNDSSSAMAAPEDTTNNSTTVVVKSYTYDSLGLGNMVQSTDANGNTTHYFYSSDSTQPFMNDIAGLSLSCVTGIRQPQSTPVLQISKQYDQFGNLIKQTDENSQMMAYGYDNLGRLTSITKPGNIKQRDISYSYFSGSIPNRVSSTNYRARGDSTISTIYYDGLGRDIQMLARFWNDDIITATTYDVMGRKEKTYCPFQATLTTPHVYDPNYDQHCNSYYPESNGYPYVKMEHTLDGTGRLTHLHPQGSIFQSEGDHRYVQHFYGSSSGLNPFSTVQQGPGWIVEPSDGRIDVALADGAAPWDDSAVLLNVPGSANSDSFTVKLEKSPYTHLPTNNLEVIIRWRAGGQVPKRLRVDLLESSTVRGRMSLDYDEEYPFPYLSDNISFPCSTITNPDSLYIKVVAHASTGMGYLDISWIRINIANSQVFRMSTTDENGKGNLVYEDRFGNTIATVVDTAQLNLMTKYEYDVNGHVTSTQDPWGLLSSFIYDTRGLVTQKITPDGGHCWYYNGPNGNMRFSRSPNQGSSFTYFKYDAENRLTESGQYTDGAGFNQDNANNVNFPDTGNPHRSLDCTYTYDLAVLNGQHYLNGRLSRSCTYNASGDSSCVTTYSYDSTGQIEWVRYGYPNQSIQDKRLTYTYDYQGNVLKKGFEDLGNGDNNLYTYNEYDQLGRLSRVYSNRTDSQIGRVKEAEYTYRADNKIKRMVLGMAQGVDYTYNERGWLTAINNQSVDLSLDPGHDGGNGIPLDKFGMHLGYNAQDYIGNSQSDCPQYNGNISWISYRMSGIPYRGSTRTTDSVGWVYSYDGANRLKSAQFGYYGNSGWSLPAAYDLTMNYDDDGNIAAMTRRNSLGNGYLDNLNYTYFDATNRLSAVAGLGGTGSSNYTYDNNGNLTQDSYRGIGSITYDIHDQPTSMTVNSQNITYSYDANQNRISKVTASEHQFYIVGPDGQTEAVYDWVGDKVRFWNILANGHSIGRIENY
jgi:YD repeat-containing protein